MISKKKQTSSESSPNLHSDFSELEGLELLPMLKVFVKNFFKYWMHCSEVSINQTFSPQKVKSVSKGFVTSRAIFSLSSSLSQTIWRILSISDTFWGQRSSIGIWGFCQVLLASWVIFARGNLSAFGAEQDQMQGWKHSLKNKELWIFYSNDNFRW